MYFRKLNRFQLELNLMQVLREEFLPFNCLYYRRCRYVFTFVLKKKTAIFPLSVENNGISDSNRIQINVLLDRYNAQD